MAAQVDLKKCTMCGGVKEPRCIEACMDTAIRVQDGKIVVTEFLCQDCNECGFTCPDHAVDIPVELVTW